jgi:hypothetical protein
MRQVKLPIPILFSTLLLLSFLLPATASAQAARSWARVWDGGAADVPGCTACRSHTYLTFSLPVVRSKHAVAVDGAGNTYLSGASWNGASYDARLVKLDPNGVPLWARALDGGAEDLAWAVGVDGAGNVYVAGSSEAMTKLYDVQPQMLLAKYDAAGTLQWTRRYDPGVWAAAFSLAVDAAGNAVIAGEVRGDDFIYALVAGYDPAGTLKWVSAPFLGFENEESSANDVVFGADGNVYVTGYVYKPGAPDYTDDFILSLSPAGARRWAASYDGGTRDQGVGVAADTAGNAFVTGPNGTLKINASGARQWASPVAGNAVAVGAGAVYVTGGGQTVRLDAASGGTQWAASSGAGDGSYALALAGGRLWVAGPSNGDALTVVYDPATGAETWRDRYDTGDIGRSETAFAIAIAPGGVVVAGAAGDDFLALRYAAPSPGVSLQNLTLTPGTIPGGCSTSTGKVTLSGPAPPGGSVVALATTNPVASIPASVTVPEGKTSATFTISAQAVAAEQTGTVTAGWGGVSDSETLKVRPVGVLSVTLGASSVTGPGRVGATVLLECAAGPSAIEVRLASSNAAVAWPDAAAITIPAGAVTGRFTVSAADVSTTTAVAIRASASGITRSAVLTVLP